MRKLLAASFFALFAFSSLALAQTPVLLPGGCGSGNITNGQGYETVAPNATLCVNLPGPNTASVTNPTSTLTLPSTTTAYTAGTLICTSPTVATCNSGLTSAFFSIANSAGAAFIPRLRLTSNDATSTAWSSAVIQVDLWSAAPTFATTGDRGSFATDFLTGTAGHIAAFTCTMGAELADGVYGECFPQTANGPILKLAAGTSIFYTLQAVNGSGVTGASKVFTLTAEVQN